MERQRSKGRVIKLVAIRGFGFIEDDLGGDPIFLHCKQMEFGKVEDFYKLCVGSRVEFLIAQGDRGPIARKVRPAE